MEEALASSEIQICNAIKQLPYLKLGSNDDPYIFISKVRNLMESVKNLKITVDHVL